MNSTLGGGRGKAGGGWKGQKGWKGRKGQKGWCGRNEKRDGRYIKDEEGEQLRRDG